MHALLVVNAPWVLCLATGSTTQPLWVRCHWLVCKRLGVQAAMTLPGALDTGAFEVFIEHFLCPVLKPGQIVIADNLSAHKSPRVKEMIEAAGCSLLFLPTYSPDLNPIEMLWSQFKSHLRREAARTQEHLDQLIWPLLSYATSHHLQNSFAHAGYT